MDSCFEKIKLFKKKYPMCVTWFRLKKHCSIIDKHLNPNETIELAIGGQLDNDPLSLFNTGVLAITNQRILVAQNRLLIGYKLSSITPDLYNDMQVDCGLIWGTLCIDTVKEKIYVSNLDKKSLPEIETCITMFMKSAKEKYKKNSDNNETTK